MCLKNEQILKHPSSAVWRWLHKNSDSERSATLHVCLIVEMEHDQFHIHATFAKGWKKLGLNMFFVFFYKFSPLRDATFEVTNFNTGSSQLVSS